MNLLNVVDRCLSSSNNERNAGELEWKSLVTTNPDASITTLLNLLLSSITLQIKLSLSQAKMICILLRKCIKTRSKLASLNTQTQEIIRNELIKLITIQGHLHNSSTSSSNTNVQLKGLNSIIRQQIAHIIAALCASIGSGNIYLYIIHSLILTLFLNVVIIL